ncbi:MAG TPA: DUF465 domain-containing protein [Xanthobacteraceae bacterium]|nr:DUF465 domain-containing protein [Xanthobacteraceae bacterium]
MSIQSHLAHLEQQHADLKNEIEQALRHPSVDDLQLAELKRRKLHIKDEIRRLKTETAAVH